MKTRARPYNLRHRLLLLGGVLGACALVVVARAAQMQLVDRDFYQRAGDARFLRELPIATSRGMITDRNGEPLAVSSPVESIWANPKELLQHPEQLPRLAQALGIPREVLTQRIAQRAGKEFVYLRRHINPDEAKAVVSHGIPGVYSQREFRRFYPHGEVMAHVLGFTNIDDRGQEGLELAFDSWLTGKPGAQRVIRDRHGRIVEHVDLLRAAEPGKDITLSIDRRIQYLAYRELKAALIANNAESGSAVVLDIPTGEILAMVNQPAYNPNSRIASAVGTHRNRAVTDVVEPGSVIKALTVAAALEDGVDPDIVIPTTPLVVSGHPIRDVHDYGPVTLERLLMKSSNIGASRLALGMDNARFHDVLQRFGFGQSTGSGFPGESAGVLVPARSWRQLEKATISYGYGLSVTSLQLAQAYAALGNGGRLIPPTFIKDGGQASRVAMDPKIATSVLHMLESVIEPGGSAPRAAITGYHVAGKTGTSRKFTVGGYEKKYISLFAGVVPVKNPRFAMVVVIHNPSGRDYYGGLVSAPVFHNVMEGALRLMDVPPDDAGQWLAAAAKPRLAPVPAPTAPVLAHEADATATEVLR